MDFGQFACLLQTGNKLPRRPHWADGMGTTGADADLE
jgi:hypothetical protein